MDKKKRIISSMSLEGKNSENTAMSYTVGIPLAIAAKLLATGKINIPAGIHLPITPNIYNPILEEMNQLGIKFVEQEISL